MTEESSENKTTYRLEGDLDTASAIKMRNDLLALFDVSKSIILNVDGLEHLNLASLQVLIASFREAGARNIGINLSGTLSPPVLEAICLFGFSKSVLSGTGQLESLLHEGTQREAL